MRTFPLTASAGSVSNRWSLENLSRKKTRTALLRKKRCRASSGRCQGLVRTDRPENSGGTDHRSKRQRPQQAYRQGKRRHRHYTPEKEVFRTHLEAFPPKSYWPELLNVLNENELKGRISGRSTADLMDIRRNPYNATNTLTCELDLEASASLSVRHHCIQCQHGLIIPSTTPLPRKRLPCIPPC